MNKWNNSYIKIVQKGNIFFLLFLFGLALDLNTQEIRLTGDPLFQEAQEWQDPLSPMEITRLALRASGVTQENEAAYLQEMEDRLDTFRAEVLPQWSHFNSYEKGEALLQWLHNQHLGEYIESQTRLDHLMDQGDFNCVSSSVYFLIFATEAGLEAHGVETKDHAFCRILFDDLGADVETTTPLGFDPGTKKEFAEEFNRTGFSYVPPGNYRSRNDANIREMIALILQNRMAIYQRQRRHAEAVGLAVDRWVLARPDQDIPEAPLSDRIIKEMNDSFRNWAASLNERGYYLEAFLFITQVSETFGLLELNQDLLYQLANNRLVDYLDIRDFQGAAEFLTMIKPSLNQEDWTSLETLLVREEVGASLDRSPYDESLQLVRNAWNKGYLSRTLYVDWITYLHQKEAIRQSEGGKWWQAWHFLNNLPHEEASLTKIRTTAGQMKQNWAITQHNLFVDMIQSEDYSGAREHLESALEKDPQNSMLKGDLRDLEKMGY